MKIRHQITQISETEYEIVLTVRLLPHSYTIYVLRWCEGSDKTEGEASIIDGKFLDGDVFRAQFNELGKFHNNFPPISSFPSNIIISLQYHHFPPVSSPQSIHNK